MALSFSVREHGKGLLISVYAPDITKPVPPILRRIVEIFGKEKTDLLILESEFPEHTKIIRALANLLTHYIVRSADGGDGSWNTDNGYSAHIHVA